MKKSKNVGIVVMSSISVGGGTARISFDLIQALNELGHKVYLMTPFKIYHQKIKERYGSSISVEKTYIASRFKYLFYRDRDFFARKIMKNEFKKMAREVDMIIDIDGGIVHEYLPKKFDKKKYVVWRIGGARVPETYWSKNNLKKRLKKLIREMFNLTKNTLNEEYRIYPVDEWTKLNVEKYWKVHLEEKYLYPAVQIEEFSYKNQKKKDQIVIFGRIAPNKRIEESIRIFALGTKLHKNYKLIITGGTTCDSKGYLDYLRKIIGKLGISKKVEVIKNPSLKNLKRIILESQVLIEAENINLTMTSIESLAAGCIVLAPKTSGTYLDVLDKGKFGYGFEDVIDGGKKLEMILNKIDSGSLNPKKFIKRAKIYSRKKFIKRIDHIIKGTF